MKVYPGSISILIHRPVETEGFTMKDRETLMEELHEIIQDCFIDIDGDSHAPRIHHIASISKQLIIKKQIIDA
jgi:hypothetical protein